MSLLDPVTLEWWRKNDPVRYQLLLIQERIMDKRESYDWRTGETIWKVKPSDEELVLWDLDYYFEAGLVNAGDVFGYLHQIIEHKEKFEAIGAKGTLAALEKLMPFYLEQQKLPTREEQDEYWWRTREERSEAESLAEDMDQFANLLLAFARKHASKFGLSEGEDASESQNEKTPS